MNKSEKRFLLEPEAISLLTSYGISYPEHGVANSVEEAVDIAERIGYPVVLKVVSSQIIHKSDVGGVVTGIKDEKELCCAYQKMLKAISNYDLRLQIEGVLVCRQAEPGWEFVVGGMQDEIFGPTIMFGLGGIYIEVFKDVSFRVCPITKKDAWEMVKEIKGYEILKGVRGKSALDLEAVIELLIKTSSMLVNNRYIKELDLNPVRVYEKGAMVLDARIMKES
jgi:acyl-CoA synthetase (NDP forming)